ncbi:zinc-dependent alcohol dehydrogenase [Oscillatoria sp. FACHB-1406]|uniref:zinc-dependent alcohol dehydrogenase n=1 Tax=Oscillatoria sp. FACHB-1406 TaxID=2692846 RepID=UPI001689495E|nr:zinc-dependent alcohol dehydrogenase [Oscillatoria sp. FACHB-1406]MBD2578199.1 glutathione-dependent formaldehyde dehydrogenase [Oscillatoria sp. FACHB-1406]
MKAVCWQGTRKIEVENVPEPTILNPRDAIVKITTTAICGSDLHLYNGYNPTMQKGDILGHEFMGEVVAVGRAVSRVKLGDRVVVPFTISCGACFFCQQDLWSLCDNSNPNAWMPEKAMGHSPSGLFGYSHLTGGYAGGQAEYARVPFADVGLFPIPEGLTDEQVVFLTDIFPTGYMAAENCHIQPGDTIAIWGCGPVGQFAIRSAFLLGAERVIAIDRVSERLQMAKAGGAEILNYEEVEVGEALNEMTAGRGPDAVIDAVGMEAHGMGLEGFFDKAMQAVKLETDRPNVLRQAIVACRKGGTVSVPGVYTGFIDKVPIGALMNKGLTLKTGQTHVHRYFQPLIERIQKGEIDPSFIITHRLPLEEAARGYEIFDAKKENCIKVVLKPGMTSDSRGVALPSSVTP